MPVYTSKQHSKQYSGLSFKDRKATILTATLVSHNLRTNRARELIKPSADSASLRLEIEKNSSAWILGSLCVTSQRGHVWAFLVPLPGPEFFFDLWLENESSEPLIDLLAHRETILWLKKTVFGKNLKFSKKVTLATSVQLWPLVVSIQMELESYLNLLKTREVFYIKFQKKTFTNFLAFLVHGPMIRVWFANILMMLSADPTRRYCASKFYWITESNTSF